MPVTTHDELFAGIDWTRPWLAPYRGLAAQIINKPDWRFALNERATSIGLTNHRGLPIRFVPQADLPQGMAYEAFISATGGVPTRNNLHDFFNALVWLTFPKIKVRLNALQSAEIEKSAGQCVSEASTTVVRGKVRDAATIFDENTALLVVRNTALVESFRAHQWQELFVNQRAVFFRHCDVWLFGHALMEKLVNPYKAITAHAWPAIGTSIYFDMDDSARQAWLDDEISAQLAGGIGTSGFTPLPILGVPGWWSGQDAAYYADVNVFRPRRKPL